MLRISLIIVIVASLASAGISFVKVKEKIEMLKTERDDWKGKFTTTDAELRTTKTDLAKTKTDLTKTKADLATTTSERDSAVNEAAKQTKRSVELADKLAKSTEARDKCDQELSQYQVVGTVAQVNAALTDAKGLRADRTNLVTTIANLGRELTVATNALYQLTGGDEQIILLPPGLRGKVVVVDPKYEFIVLDVGGNSGLKENGVLLVNRNGKLVAKIKVRSVQSDRAIANVISGWKIGEVMEGDSVLPGI